LDGGRARARHLGLLGGDQLRARRARLQTCSTRRATRISAQWDFSEDTYRTLTAVDSAVMVLDAAKGIEEQTRKLFEVFRLRDVPIITFVNKPDREGRDPFDLLDEIEQSLALDVSPASWPIGMGRDFLGTYDLFASALLLFERGVHDRVTEPIRCNGLDDPQLPRLLPKRPWPNCARRSKWRRGCVRLWSAEPAHVSEVHVAGTADRRRKALPLRSMSTLTDEILRRRTFEIISHPDAGRPS
jgi:peptide subunit release factor RF-3